MAVFAGFFGPRVFDLVQARQTAPEPIVVSFDDGYLSQCVAGFLVLQTFHWPGVMNLHLSSDLPDQDVKKMVAAG